jgi:hypothetical protein
MWVLVLFLVMVIVVLALMCLGLQSQKERQAEELVQVRKQLDQYLSDDQRTFDTLWNRAQIETARAIRSRTYE